MAVVRGRVAIVVVVVAIVRVAIVRVAIVEIVGGNPQKIGRAHV